MQLSNKAIKDLKIALEKENSKNLTDEELNEIGLFLLTSLLEKLKLNK